MSPTLYIGVTLNSAYLFNKYCLTCGAESNVSNVTFDVCPLTIRLDFHKLLLYETIEANGYVELALNPSLKLDLTFDASGAATTKYSPSGLIVID